MKTLDVPFIEGLAEMDDAAFLRALEEGGARFSVDQVGWPEVWPYCPETQGAIAHCNDGLAIRFHVRGFDLRAENLSDNGRQWEDSCCEFFVAGPAGYYNFEINCGLILCFKLLNVYNVSVCYLVLLSACFDYCVHFLTPTCL